MKTSTPLILARQGGPQRRRTGEKTSGNRSLETLVDKAKMTKKGKKASRKQAGIAAHFLSAQGTVAAGRCSNLASPRRAGKENSLLRGRWGERVHHVVHGKRRAGRIG